MNAETQAKLRLRGEPGKPRSRADDPLTPPAQGLYDPAKEHDSCGVGFVADMKNRKSHDILEKGLQILVNLDHRGAVGADPTLGDGCGVLTQIPHAFFAPECAKLGFDLPEPGHYAIGQFFMPRDRRRAKRVREIVKRSVAGEGQKVLGWRDVPVDNSAPRRTRQGGRARDAADLHRPRRQPRRREDDFERRLFIVRKVISNPSSRQEVRRSRNIIRSRCRPARSSTRAWCWCASSRPIISTFWTRASRPRSRWSHQRFATNTFPSWRLAHPYRMVAHNGEINTLRGNVNWMAARQASVASELFGTDISKLWPISYEGQSDTACFDNALEFLVRGGYSLSHAMMMLIPEAWAGNPLMDEERRAFYEYHAALMEPWDGPAAVAFTDGRQIGATLDRNGLRPARYFVTDDDLVVLASEMGVLPVPEEIDRRQMAPAAGEDAACRPQQHRIVSDAEIKQTLVARPALYDWLAKTQIVLEELNPVEPRASRTDVSLLDRQQAFGYTQEDLSFLLAPMATTGQEAVGSMGTDTPISALSSKSKLLYTYFKQNFAQVTNPPIDPIREELVMSLVSFIGPRPNLFDLDGTARRKRLEVRQPILTNEDLEKIRCIGHLEDSFDTKTLDITYPVKKGAEGMGDALKRLCERAEAGGPWPLQHHHPFRPHGRAGSHPNSGASGDGRRPSSPHPQGLRTSVGLVVETGEAREIHHFACLAGYGAEAINPYLAFETLTAMAKELARADQRL